MTTPFAELDVPGKSAAISALNAATDALVAERPTAADEIRAVAMRHVANIVKTDDGFSMAVEYPRFETMPDYSGDYVARLQYEDGPRAVFNADGVDGLFCMGTVRVTVIRDALALLVGDASPEQELARRRAALAKKKADAAVAEEAAREAARVRSAEMEQYNRLNARRIEAWNALDCATQALFAAAGKFPQFAGFVSAYVAAREQRTVVMPANFRPELAGG